MQAWEMIMLAAGPSPVPHRQTLLPCTITSTHAFAGYFPDSVKVLDGTYFYTTGNFGSTGTFREVVTMDFGAPKDIAGISLQSVGSSDANGSGNTTAMTIRVLVDGVQVGSSNYLAGAGTINMTNLTLTGQVIRIESMSASISGSLYEILTYIDCLDVTAEP